MGGFMQKLLFIAAALLLLAGPGVASAADPAEVRITQAVVRLPDVSTYLNIRDDAGNPVAGIAAPKVTASLGGKPLTVRSIQPVSREDSIAYVFVVDISRSLAPHFTDLKRTLGEWMKDLGPGDRASLWTLGDKVTKLVDYTGNVAELQGALATLSATDGNTMLYKGLKRALDETRRSDEALPARRVIVVLTDGMDDEVGATTRDEVTEDLKRDPVPIHAVVYNTPKGKRGVEALRVMGGFTRASGGELVVDGGKGLSEAALSTRRAIHGGLKVVMSCPDCVADGAPQHLDLTMAVGERRLTSAGTDVRMVAGPKPVASPSPVAEPKSQAVADPAFPAWYAWAGGAAVLVLGGAGLVFARRRPALEPNPRIFPVVIPQPMVPTNVIGRPDPVIPVGVTGTIPRPSPVPGLPLRLVPVGKSAMSTVEIDIHERLSIGRGRGNDVVVPDETASGSHCQLIRAGERVMVEDVGSANGTWVNGVRLQAHQTLNVGDIITVGKTELRFVRV